MEKQLKTLAAKLSLLLVLAAFGMIGGATFQGVFTPETVKAREVPEGVCVLDAGCLCSYECESPAPNHTCQVILSGSGCVQT